MLDAFHVVKLASSAMDEVRRRVQQDTLGRRGHRDDPLYRIRRLLTTARENLTDHGRARLEAASQAGDPGLEVTVAWHAYQDLRSMFHAPTPAAGRAIAQRVLDSFHPCPIPEIARLGRTLRSWRSEVLAYFDDDPGPVRDQQRRHWSHQFGHRNDPAPGARVPQLRQLPHPHPARR